MSEDKFLKVQQRAEAVAARYRESQSKYFNILLLGDSGSGKTATLATCPTPLFIDSFDSGGTKTQVLQPLIERGDIVCETRWEKDSWKEPFAFREWEMEMAERKREGFFDHFATYALDSGSKWSDSLMFAIIAGNKDKGGKTRRGQNPELQDYLVQQLTAVDWIGQLMSLPCNVVVTAHIGIDKDELTGRIETGPLMYGKLALKLPIAFDECWIMRPQQSSIGPAFKVLVHADGYHKAKSRIGGSKFSMLENPDVRGLMKKAEAPKESWTDRPPLLHKTAESE